MSNFYQDHFSHFPTSTPRAKKFRKSSKICTYPRCPKRFGHTIDTCFARMNDESRAYNPEKDSTSKPKRKCAESSPQRSAFLFRKYQASQSPMIPFITNWIHHLRYFPKPQLST